MAAETPRHPYEVKAALMHAFTKVVQWPPESFPEPGSPFVIGILGKDPFGNHMAEVLEKKTAQNRPIAIRRLRDADEAGSCHMLFLGVMPADEEADILRRLSQSPVLTIGESDSFWDHQGAIQFLHRDNRVQFRINVEATVQAGLAIDPNVLKIAAEVRPAKPRPRPAEAPSE